MLVCAVEGALMLKADKNAVRREVSEHSISILGLIILHIYIEPRVCRYST